MMSCRARESPTASCGSFKTEASLDIHFRPLPSFGYMALYAQKGSSKEDPPNQRYNPKGGTERSPRMEVSVFLSAPPDSLDLVNKYILQSRTFPYPAYKAGADTSQPFKESRGPYLPKPRILAIRLNVASILWPSIHICPFKKVMPRLQCSPHYMALSIHICPFKGALKGIPGPIRDARGGRARGGPAAGRARGAAARSRPAERSMRAVVKALYKV